MAPSTMNLDITILPPDVLSLCDEPFYELVSKLAGPVEAKLLQVQGVRSVYSLLFIDDIFDILKYQCKELDEIKKKVCLRSDDNQQIIKPGCKSNLKYFTQLLRLKNQEHMKAIGLMIKSKRSSNDDGDGNISTIQSSLQALSESSSISQDTSAISTPSLPTTTITTSK
uniref:Uncharacterized protein n=1 Tax=Adineta vaga TaxID=104782 RepID=B3G4J9_ADIVA|nr:unknown [Adineta vaga]